LQIISGAQIKKTKRKIETLILTTEERVHRQKERDKRNESIQDEKKQDNREEETGKEIYIS
jgi:hypothetical protein